MLEVEERLISILERNSKNKVGQNVESINIIDDLGLDSISLIKVVIDIEKEFKIEFDDEQLDFRELALLPNLRQYIIMKVENSYCE